MLRIVTGPLHPSLDRALVEELRALKAGDPFAPLAVVVPSATLAERLKRLLAVESQLAFLHLHVLTFHQFALRLRDDLAGKGRPIPSMQLVDDFFFEQLLRQIVMRRLPGLDALSTLPPSPGTWKGLWATLRDLKDAVVQPATALKAVTEDLFEADDRPWLQSLFTLHAAMLEGSRSLGVGSADDLVASFGDDLSQSTFLTQFRRICYFGFYDLLQVQLSFFESVVRCAPVTLYFPLGTGPAHTFARRYFERYLLPLAAQHEDLGRPGEGVSQRVELAVTDVIGSEEELASVCREIVTLVETRGYRFDEIGVVARSFDQYRTRLQAVFDRHLIPFTSTAGRMLLREPLVKALLRLASLLSNNFERQAVLDVLASPFCRRDRDGLTIEPRPDVWQFVTAKLGIAQGKSEWSRLTGSAAASVLHEAATEGEAIGAERQDEHQSALLSLLAMALIEDCEQLPRRGSARVLTDAFTRLAQNRFVVPGLTEPDQTDAENDTELYRIGLLVKQALERLAQLDSIGAEYSWEEWTELFRLALENQTVPIAQEPHQGVQVLDAMEARGLQFRALFVIGLNDHTFPRTVREDPFLRDRQRLVLASTLGFLVEEKLAGHEEEQLLFELLCRSATTRLFLSYQRADEEGRVTAPSAFVSAALRDASFIAAQKRSIPRRLVERVDAEPASREALPLRDLALTLLLEGRDAGPVVDCLGQDRHLFVQGIAVQDLMERDSPELGPFDGVLSPPVTMQAPVQQTGLSATALERYATCPFQFLSQHILRLEPVRAIRHEHLPALTLGTLVHETLRLSYERLASLQWPDATVEPAVLTDIIEKSAASVFSGHAATKGTGHALLWTMAQEQVVGLVAHVVRFDQDDYRSTGYRPYAFETEAEGVLNLDAGSSSLKVRGKLDRIDVRPDPPGVRIVDYKFKQGREMEPKDRNLLLGAARGYRLQPPLYASMRLPSLPATADVQLLYLAPQWNPPVARSIFEHTLLQGNTGKTIVRTVRTLVEGIERQEFFILPDGYCDRCEFSSACRRNDQAAWWRSYRSPQAGVLRRLRKVKIADE